LASAKEPGTLHAFPAGDWALALSDQELGEIRGGIRGVSFEVFAMWFAEVSSLDDPTNGLILSPVIAGSVGGLIGQPFGINNGEVNLITEIGDFNGGSGIFQIVQVPGSNNIINNNLFINITLDGAAIGQLPLGGSLLGR
jgi:small ligand-binding sensory domain FIST